MKRSESIEEKKLTVRQKIWKNKELYSLLLLPILYFTIFRYGTFVWLSIAFKDFTLGKTLFTAEWVGFKHFRSFLEDPYFWNLIGNTLTLSVLLLIFSFPFTIILALMINEVHNKAGKKLVQSISYLPHFFSTVVVCGMVVNLLSTDGLINNLLSMLGLSKIPFMTSLGWFRPIYVISDIWQSVGWGSIIYIAALSGIDAQLYEAAVLDGASRWKQILHISIPGILPVISIQFLLRLGGIINIGYEKILLLYNGSTMPVADVISTYVYRRGLMGTDYSYGTAVGLFQTVIGLILMASANQIVKKLDAASLW